MNEFDLIERLKPLSMGRIEAQNFSNDAAVLDIPDGMELVVTTDCATSGVHFLPHQPPGTIAQKALRRNVSDLNAMGARPLCYQMAVMLPGMDKDFLDGFIAGLLEDQKRYGLFLSGGDISSTPGPLSIVITAFGLVEKGKAWSRSGAQPGDQLVLGGLVGDAACGLKALREGLDEPALIAAYQTPPVHLAHGIEPRAAIDISDGLVQDVAHICRASGLAAEFHIENMQFSPAVQAWLDAGRVSYQELLSGGDDYVLALAMPPDAAVPQGFQVIGEFVAGAPAVRVFRGGKRLENIPGGWQHFS